MDERENERAEAIEAAMERLVRSGAVRYDPATGKYFAMVDREEMERRMTALADEEEEAKG